MRVEQVEADILVFVGDAYESVATAFLHDGQALLVDALASRPDAQRMRAHLERLGCQVRVIVCTHYMSDHLAGLRLFPGAETVAHRYFLHTFLSQQGRSAEDDRDYVAPTMLLDGSLALNWGRHRLEVFHSPGKTLCTLCVDVRSADLLLVSDTLVGNIAYVSCSAPALIEDALERLQARGRGRIVPGHMGVLPAAALGNARHYPARLRARVVESERGSDPARAVRSIAIEECLAPGLEAKAFEREWHARNLEIALERRVFRLDA